MRIRITEDRERLFDNLLEASPHGTKSGAIDDAVRFYCRMVGGNGVNPQAGNLAELMKLADDQGSVTAEEIATILDTDEIPVEASTAWTVGVSDES